MEFKHAQAENDAMPQKEVPQNYIFVSIQTNGMKVHLNPKHTDPSLA